jgi:hypothetical protein
VSAVIYAAIVVMWAVVLVPMWLRRHDAASESRSVDRFSTAMRTLSRRAPATPGRRYVVMPKRSEAGPSVHVSGAAAPKPREVTAQRAAAVPPVPAVASPAPRSAPRSVPRPAPRRRPSIVARRRRLLLGLLVVTLVTFVLAAVGVLSWPLQLVVDVVLVAFCLHLRAQARRSAELARSRRAAAAPAVRRAPAVPAVTPAAAPTVPATTPTAAPAAVEREVVAEESLPATGTDGVAEPTAETWEPVPVPRPTYTMKPPAPAFEADPTYAPPVYEPAARVEVELDEDRETDLDEILERRWAVND